MAIIKCKMCGGDITVAEDKTFGTCEYCGSTMTFPKVSDEQRAAAFNRGNHFRRMGEFDKALAVYERIVAEDDGDAEAHWCCALCRFGIEYVEDPTTYEWLPTCHRVSFDSFLEDVDYLAALEHSDGITRRQYQKDAAKIAEVQRGILATSQNTEPYDVFLSYKELDAEGNRTRDSILAQDIYYQLTEKGWRVFFSRISLEDVPGTQYEPYIFAALNSAKVMIVVGTSAENLNAVWVKNEWSRYLSLMRKDRSKLLLPCYRDMDPYDLPEQLSVLMSYDMGKIGFIQDLIRGVDKVLNADKPKEETPAPVQERVIVQQSGGGPNATALLKRGQQALEDGDWDQARSFYDQVLSMDAENAEAFLGLALAGSRSKSPEEYVNRLCVRNTEPEVRTLPRDEAHIREQLERLPVPGYLQPQWLLQLYQFEQQYGVLTPGQKAAADAARKQFDADRSLSRAFRYASGETKQTLNGMKASLEAGLARLVKDAEQTDRETEQAAREAYAAQMKQVDQEAERRSRTAQEKREAEYQAACFAFEAAYSPEKYRNAAALLKQLGDYQDSAEKRQKAIQKADELEKAEQEAKAKAKAAAKKKRKKLAIIISSTVAAVAILALAAFLIVTKVIIPSNQYKQAEALLEAGKYEEAAAAFKALDGYKDSAERIAEAEEVIHANAYVEAEAFLEAGQYEEAIAAFEALDGYKDSKTRITEAEEAIHARDYAEAEELLEAGNTAQAAITFGKLGSYRDARERSRELWDSIAERQTVSAGPGCTFALKMNGTVLTKGSNNSGQCDVSGWTNVVAISSGGLAYCEHTVGLRADGTVVAVGYNKYGLCDVSDWTDIVAISAGDYHTVGLRADGTVVAVGDNSYGRCRVSGWVDIVAVSAGGSHTVGLRADGTVVAVGSSGDGRCNVSDWTDIVAVSAGLDHTVGLRADGTVVAVGSNGYGQCEVDRWTDVVAVSAGFYQTVALRADGTVVAVGWETDSLSELSEWTDIVAVSAGASHTVGLKANGTVLADGSNVYGQCDVSGWRNIKVPEN